MNGTFFFDCSTTDLFTVAPPADGCIISGGVLDFPGVPPYGNINSSINVPITDGGSPEFGSYFNSDLLFSGQTGFVDIDITTNGVISLARTQPIFNFTVTAAATITLASSLFKQYGRIDGPFGSPPAKLTAAEEVAAAAQRERAGGSGGSNNSPSIRAELPTGSIEPSLDREAGVVTLRMLPSVWDDTQVGYFVLQVWVLSLC